MKKIRVLHMPVANARGGITQYVLNLWRGMDRERFVFDFATRSPSLDFAEQVRASGSRVHHLTCSSLEDEGRFIREMDAILARGYDAVHLHTISWNGFPVEKLAVERRVPRILVHAHAIMVDIADPEKRRRAVELHERLKREFTPDLATDFCACSRAAGDWLFGEQIPRERIRILPNAIDTDAFSFKPEVRERVRRELGLGKQLALGHIGRFAHSKNHEFLLAVMRDVRDVLPHAVLLLVGDGELWEATRQQAEKFGLGDRVRFLGRRDDAADLLQAMDVYVHPSRFEGLGLTLIEAQTSGLPCLTSEHVPPEAKITPNLSYLPLNRESWIEAITRVSRTHTRRDCSEMAALSGYSLKNQIGPIEALYTRGAYGSPPIHRWK